MSATETFWIALEDREKEMLYNKLKKLEQKKEIMMRVVDKVDLKELYEIDDYLWIQKTVKLLKEKKFNQLDLENLIEELDDLGREKKHRVESFLEQIIRHLLLLEYWKSEYEFNSAHGEAEVTGFRTQLRKSLTTNLYNHLHQELISIYQDALKYVKRKSRLNTFPDQCPYTLEQLLDENWFPPINDN